MIYYVAFYNPKEEVGRRVANYAGEDKIDYICEVLNRIGENVTILSNTKSIQHKFLHTTQYSISEKKSVILFSTFPKSNILVHAIDVLWGYMQLMFYLFIHVKQEDTVLVYHSLGYRNIFSKLRKIKKFQYILEVEELFQFIRNANSGFKKKENIVFKYPDAYIFSNKFLEEKVNIKHKSSIIINGVYKIEKKFDIIQDCKKNIVVYAGSLEEQKGVDYIIRSAQFLDNNYELRIIGFGNQDDIRRISSLIDEVSKITTCNIRFDGSFKGDSYLKYLQSCNIGVCIQDPDDPFNLYEFPSKIFSYMSNGLKVVVNRLAQIEQSDIYEHVAIVNGTSPVEIAKAIKGIRNIQSKSDDVLNELDNKFKMELQQLLRR